MAGFAGLAWLLADATATADPSPTVVETAPSAGFGAPDLAAATSDATAPHSPPAAWTGTADTTTFGTGIFTGDGSAHRPGGAQTAWPSQATTSAGTTEWSGATAWPSDGATAAGWEGGASPWPSGAGLPWADGGAGQQDAGADWAQVWTGVAAAGWATGAPGPADDPLTGDHTGPTIDTTQAGSPDTDAPTPIIGTPAAPQHAAAVAGPGEVVPAERQHSAAARQPVDRPAAADPAADPTDPAAGPAVHQQNPPAPRPPAPAPTGSTGTGSSSSGTNQQCPTGTVANGPARPAVAEACVRTTVRDHEAPIWRSERATTSPD